MDSFIPTMKVGSFNRRTSCTARSTSGYLRQYAGTWSAGQRGGEMATHLSNSCMTSRETFASGMY